tara:strand:- start:1074 stop:1406 length:333 start_codon:yes stop_codon:yes gene_type:complete
MLFDPNSLTVKKAIAKLDGLTDEELSAVYDAELEGKGRKSLLDAVTSARDDIREVSSILAEAPVAAEPAAEQPVAAEPAAEIDEPTFRLLSQNERRDWKMVSAGRYVRVG